MTYTYAQLREGGRRRVNQHGKGGRTPRLSNEQVDAIRAACVGKPAYNQELAKEYGVTTKTIYNIVKGRSTYAKRDAPTSNETDRVDIPPKRKGEKGKPILTPNEVNQMRYQYVYSSIRAEDLSNAYGVSIRLLKHAIYGRGAYGRPPYTPLTKSYNKEA